MRSLLSWRQGHEMPDRFGVVIPAYNSERYIEETILSVKQQTAKDWELVVVDDGSYDRTPEIVNRLAASDERIRVITQSNRGLRAARDQGFAALGPDSEYVAFLDADDV